MALPLADAKGRAISLGGKVTYCYKCPQCSFMLERSNRDPYDPDPCPACGSGTLRRDYRAESVGVGSGVRVSRTGTNLEQARLFLPDNREFAGPGDPDGKKGAREWLDTHQPKESGGNNPLLEIERRSF